MCGKLGERWREHNLDDKCFKEKMLDTCGKQMAGNSIHIPHINVD